MDERLKEITDRIDAIREELGGLVEKAEASDTSKEEVEGVKAKIDGFQETLDTLTSERDARIQELEFKALTARVETLDKALEDARKPAANFHIGPTDGKAATEDGDNPYADGAHSVFKDVMLANRGRSEAIERLSYGLPEADQKAMTEGTGSQGGYLVVKQIERQLVEQIELSNVLRDLCTKVNVNTNSVEFDRIQIGTTAGWVAELATKPESTSLSLATVTANVFAAAGLATISNQLLSDSVPSVDTLVIADLAKRLTALEEDAFLNGDGTGKPLGLLNTPGVQTATVSNTNVTTAGTGLLDTVLDAISLVQTVGQTPNAIILHPRTWTTIVKARDTVNHFYIDAATTSQRGDVYSYNRSLFGLPVVLSNRVPTNLGGGTESRVIVGNFDEAIILDRQGLTVDESPHVYFTSNQTVFRAEKRVGFTAARIPTAFCVIGGAGLAGQ